MKLLLVLIPSFTTLNGINSFKSLIKNDGYVYNLSNLKTDHVWNDKAIAKNDININLYNLEDISQSLYNVYEQITYSLDYKYRENELQCLKTTDIFRKQINEEPTTPSLYLKLKILNQTSNWKTAGIDENPISMDSFKFIEKETDNEVYSLNLEALFTNNDEWDSDGKFDFSVNITSINYQNPINIFTKEIQDYGLDLKHGLNDTESSANGNTVSTSFDPNHLGPYKNGAYTFRLASISNLFNGLDNNSDAYTFDKYINKFYLNFNLDTNTYYSHENDQSVPKDNIDQKFDLSFHDYSIGNIAEPAIPGDSKIFDDYEDSDLEKQENPYNNSKIQNIKSDCISGNIFQSFWWGKSGNTASYFTKYFGTEYDDFKPICNYFFFRIFTIGCGTSSSAYSFKIHFQINSFTCKFNSDVWDNIPK